MSSPEKLYDPHGQGPYDPRITIPDIYKRGIEASRAAEVVATGGAGDISAGATSRLGWVRMPQVRGSPVYRRFIIYELVVGVAAVPLLNQQAQAETLVVQVTSAAANPVFFGNQGVTATGGTRVNPGQAIVLEEDNRRYEQETVRAIQELCELVAVGFNITAAPPNAYWNPRVVLNPNDFFVVTQIQRPVTVTLFYPPERV